MVILGLAGRGMNGSRLPRRRYRWEGVICFAAYQTWRVVVGFRERHKAFQEWFTPRRRRRAGGTLLAIGAVGIFIYPGQYWFYVVMPGMMWFMSAWPPELDGKH